MGGAEEPGVGHPDTIELFTPATSVAINERL